MDIILNAIPGNTMYQGTSNIGNQFVYLFYVDIVYMHALCDNFDSY